VRRPCLAQPASHSTYDTLWRCVHHITHRERTHCSTRLAVACVGSSQTCRPKHGAPCQPAPGLLLLPPPSWNSLLHKPGLSQKHAHDSITSLNMLLTTHCMHITIKLMTHRERTHCSTRLAVACVGSRSNLLTATASWKGSASCGGAPGLLLLLLPSSCDRGALEGCAAPGGKSDLQHNR
jgi:hypothetical protein